MKTTSMVMTLLLMAASLTAQTTMELQSGETRLKVEFFTPTIVHVTKTAAGQQPLQRSLVVTATPTQVALTRKGNSLSSGQLTVKADTKTGRLSFHDGKGRTLLQEKACIVATTTNDRGLRTVAQTFALDRDEAIYGLGTLQDGKLNRRGTHKRMEQSNLEDFQNVVQSIKGWGLFWDNYSPTEFSDDSQGMTLTSEVGTSIDYYFMYGGSPDGNIRLMRQLTGDVPMFPLWTFGYFQSKERYKSAKELLDVLKKYRQLHIPIDCIVQDWQYWGSNYLWNAMDFLAEDFQKGKQMIDEVHRLNARLMISIWASFGPQTKAFRELEEKDLLFDFQTWPQSGLSHIWPPRMDYPSGVRVYDAFSSEARDIYWQNLKTLYDYGVDAWWMDSTDPDCFNPTEANYTHKAGTQGGTWRSLRNAFPLETVRGVYQAQRKQKDNKKRVFIMTRSAFAGQQHYGSNMWSGDVASSWDMLRKQVPAGLSFTLTGNPNFNTDIGGFFCSAYNTKGNASAPSNPQYQELYVRWMQYALFCPVFRSHGADAPREVWQFGKEGEPVYDAIVEAIRLRYRLIPYLYSTAWQVTSNADSYLRPLICDFANDKRVWDMADEFMFGRSILAAPILSAQYTEEKVICEDAMTGWNRKKAEGQTSDKAADFTRTGSVTKYLPKGADWYDFWTGRRYHGGQSVTLETTLDRVPMFVRAGSIVPLGPDMQYTGEKNWDDLELRLYTGADATFTLYEDEGDGYQYEKGAYSTICISWEEKTRTLTFGAREGSYAGMVNKRSFTVVTPDGKRQKLDYDGRPTTVRL